MSRHISLIFAPSICLVLVLCALSYASIDPVYQPNLAILKADLQKQGFSPEELTQIFSDNRFQIYPHIVNRSGKGMNYLSRQFGLLSSRSVKRGKEVMARYDTQLKGFEHFYGVEKEVIVAILRIETNFGSKTGTYPVINSLATMAIVESRRSEWARNELAELLSICKEQNRDPFSIRGSWAGAFGISQFMPSSYVNYGVDGNKDGVIDLLTMSESLHTSSQERKNNYDTVSSPE